jgi:DnaJ-class molecular chaperone
VTLEDAYAGMQKTIQVPTSVQCGSCNGSGAEGTRIVGEHPERRGNRHAHPARR